MSAYLINNRTLTGTDQKISLSAGKNYLFDLSYLSLIDVEGNKALEFLQGQLTCDVHAISDIQIAQGAQCNLKGRILAFMDVLNWKGIKLVLPEDLADATINSFNKVAMLSRVTLKKNLNLKLFGFYLQSLDDLVPDAKFFPDAFYALTYGASYCFYHLGNGFYVFVTEPEFAAKIVAIFEEKNQLLGSLSWHTMRLAKKQVEIYPESRGLFLPHRLDLHQTPYLSFNKGCYKGQEIIARMHYKATLKHELKLFVVETQEKLYSGQKVLNELNGAELGELVDFSPLSPGKFLVALSFLKNAGTVVLFEGHERAVPLEEYKE